MRRSTAVAAGMLLVALAVGRAQTAVSREGPLVVGNAGGLQLLVARENTDPTLRISLPGGAASFPVLFPEHVTSVKHGSDDGERLYMFTPGRSGARPRWRRAGSSLEYERDFPGDIHLLARATLEDDGVRLRYEFTNRSAVAYDNIYAPTDPRLTGILHDERLERTYVHHANGFDLLASETPERLTMPLDRWLPVRYLAQLTAPIPAQRVQKRDDGITYHYKSRPVDQPLYAGHWTTRCAERSSSGHRCIDPSTRRSNRDDRDGLSAVHTRAKSRESSEE